MTKIIVMMKSLLINDEVIKVKTKKSKKYIYRRIFLIHDCNLINLKDCLHYHHLHALEATYNIKIVSIFLSMLYSYI